MARVVRVLIVIGIVAAVSSPAVAELQQRVNYSMLSKAVKGTVGGGDMSGFGSCYMGQSRLTVQTYTYNAAKRKYEWQDSAVHTGFCIDLSQSIREGNTPMWAWEGEAPLVGAPSGNYAIAQWQAERIGELWAEHYETDVWRDGVYNAANGAAFQAAIWEIIYQAPLDGREDRANAPDASTYDVSASWKPASKGGNGEGFMVKTGSGTWTAAMAATANSWLRALGDGPYFTNLESFRSVVHQDFLIIGQAFTVPVVPAPAAFVLGAMGLALVGRMRRRS